MANAVYPIARVASISGRLISRRTSRSRAAPLAELSLSVSGDGLPGLLP
jgi:hypothetical protein